MGTKRTTDTTQHEQDKATFDPFGLSVYQRLQPQLGGFFNQYLSGPLERTPGYQEGLRAATEAAGLLGGRGVSNVGENIRASGYGGRISSGFQQELLQRAGYNTSALQANAFLQNYLNQLGIRNQVAFGAEGFRPLQTGGIKDATGRTVERTSGLGTFLPQIAGAAIGGLAGGFAGGGGFGLGNFFRGAAGLSPSTSTPFFQTPFGAFEHNFAGPAPNPFIPYTSQLQPLGAP